MEKEIKNIIEQRGITRLCHFTKAKNLPHILEKGILANDFIKNDYTFDPNDKLRLDGKTKYINCSIQIPNIFYFNNIYEKDIKFKEWIVLFINPHIIDNNSMFCPVNAAKCNGIYIEKGVKAFEKLFDDIDEIGNIYRTKKMKNNIPTNIQAEVLIYKEIPTQFIEAIAVPTEEQAKREICRLKTLKKKILPIYIIPDLFNKQLSDKIRRGIEIEEAIYKEGRI